MSNYSLFSSSPTEAEAMGLLEAIKLAIAQGFQLVIFESDCKLVADV